MFKSIFARIGLAVAIAGSALVAAPVPEAQAKVSIGIYIGPGAYWRGPGYYNGYYRPWITCNQGANMVYSRGYDRVRFVDCAPRYYLYKASRWGVRYILRVDSRWGTIVGRTRD